MRYERVVTPVAIISNVCISTICVLIYIRYNLIMVSVRGTSMAPNLRPGDRILVRRDAIGSLRVGDLVVFRTPEFHAARNSFRDGRYLFSETRWSIKRLVALPGDPVPKSIRASTHGISHVPADMYVVIGDNYDRSTDSRHWGFLPKSQIIGSTVHCFPRSHASFSIAKLPGSMSAFSDLLSVVTPADTARPVPGGDAIETCDGRASHSRTERTGQ